MSLARRAGRERMSWLLGPSAGSGRGAVVMMKAAEHGDGTDGTGEPGLRPFGEGRNPLADPLVGPSAVEVAQCVLPEDMAQMPLRQDDHVIEALAADAPQKSLADRVH